MRAVTNVQGTTLVAYDYTAFGEVRREYVRPVNGAPQKNPARANAWRYAGERADAQTGLAYHRARYYDPSVGRFTQADPIGPAGGQNLYAYAANNPTTLADHSGLAPEKAEPVPTSAGGRGKAEPFRELAQWRRDLGMASVSSPQGRSSVLTRLDAGGKKYYGINNHGQSYPELPFRRKESITHAEADSFGQAARAGVRGG